jgi:TolB-like protein/DNA-binding winged helix-turn-helix (wHTH) protein/Flp pilus assembly protein TadD
MTLTGGIIRKGKVQFGDFTLDIREHSLRRRDRPIALRPKTFDTFAFLVERHGRLVTKDELLTALWAGVVVTEGTLTHCIEEIRDALGDDPRHPQFIQTVSRVGYRFIADLHPLSAELRDEPVLETDEYTAVKLRFSGTAASDPSTPEPPNAAVQIKAPSGHGKRAALVATMLVLIFLIVGGILWYSQPFSSKTITSLAVLPFENLSGNMEEEYFADGLTDALISDLARIGRLRVISRTSVMHYKAQRKTLHEIGQELQVDAVVEGSVFRSGDQVRTTASLITTASERRIWGGTFERNKGDLLTLIREMTRTVASEIKIELTAAEQAELSPSHSTDSPAYELYLKGRYHWNMRSPGGFQKAIEYFERALKADSQYAPALIGLADCYNLLGDYDLLEPNLAFPKGRAASLRALAIDSTLADAHASLAFAVTRYDWIWAEAEHEYKRAIALNASCSNAHHWYALFLATQGRMTEAKAEIARALELDPLSQIIATNRAWVCYFAGENDEAIAVCRDVLRRDSLFASAHIKLGWALEQRDLHAEAQLEFTKATEIVGDNPVFRSMRARSLALQGNRRKAVTLIAEVIDESHSRYVPGYHVAAAYAGLRERALALQWLKKSLEERSGWLIWLNVDPKFESLRLEPEFSMLLDSLRLR